MIRLKQLSKRAPGVPSGGSKIRGIPITNCILLKSFKKVREGVKAGRIR